MPFRAGIVAVGLGFVGVHDVTFVLAFTQCYLAAVTLSLAKSLTFAASIFTHGRFARLIASLFEAIAAG